MMALFGHGGAPRGGGGGGVQKNLVEFRAGKLNLRDRMLHADKRKGLVFVKRRSEDGLMHFCWKDRTTGAVEDVSVVEKNWDPHIGVWTPGTICKVSLSESDLFLFPDDAEFKRIPQCTTGRAYVLKFKTSSRRLFFWMQEPKVDKDDEYCRKVNEALNNPDAAMAAAMAEEGGGGLRGGLPPNIAAALAGQLGNSGLANLVSNMDQQQLLQLLGGSGGGGYDIATLAGLMSSPSSTPSSASGRSRGESATPATGQPSATTSSASIQTPATAASHMQPNAPSRRLAAADGSGPGSSHYVTSQPPPARVQLSDLQKALQSVCATTSDKEEQPEMSQVMPPEVARQLLSDPVVRQRLLPLMPEGLGDDEESMVGVVSSPQFQQALRMFGSVLQTGQLGPVVGQFDVSEAARTAAVEGDVAGFLHNIQGSSGPLGSEERGADEESAKNMETEEPKLDDEVE